MPTLSHSDTAPLPLLLLPATILLLTVPSGVKAPSPDLLRHPDANGSLSDRERLLVEASALARRRLGAPTPLAPLYENHQGAISPMPPGSERGPDTLARLSIAEFHLEEFKKRILMLTNRTDRPRGHGLPVGETSSGPGGSMVVPTRGPVGGDGTFEEEFRRRLSQGDQGIESGNFPIGEGAGLGEVPKGNDRLLVDGAGTASSARRPYRPMSDAQMEVRIFADVLSEANGQESRIDESADSSVGGTEMRVGGASGSGRRDSGHVQFSLASLDPDTHVTSALLLLLMRHYSNPCQSRTDVISNGGVRSEVMNKTDDVIPFGSRRSAARNSTNDVTCRNGTERADDSGSVSRLRRRVTILVYLRNDEERGQTSTSERGNNERGPIAALTVRTKARTRWVRLLLPTSAIEAALERRPDAQGLPGAEALRLRVVCVGCSGNARLVTRGTRRNEGNGGRPARRRNGRSDGAKRKKDMRGGLTPTSRITAAESSPRSPVLRTSEPLASHFSTSHEALSPRNARLNPGSEDVKLDSRPKAKRAEKRRESRRERKARQADVEAAAAEARVRLRERERRREERRWTRNSGRRPVLILRTASMRRVVIK